MLKSFTVCFLSIVFSVSLLAQSGTNLYKAIQDKGFESYSLQKCDGAVPLSFIDSKFEIESSAHYQVDYFLVDELYKLSLPKKEKIVWYALRSKTGTDLNFSIKQTNPEAILNFVLYEKNTADDHCPEEKDKVIPVRVVLMNDQSNEKGIGLTGEALSNYTDELVFDNLVHHTPYHKSIYLRPNRLYLMQVRDVSSIGDVAHTLTVGKAKLQILNGTDSDAVMSNANKEPGATQTTANSNSESKLKNFLYGGGNKKSLEDENATANNEENEQENKSEEDESITYNYDDFLYVPEDEEDLEAPSLTEALAASTTSKGNEKKEQNNNNTTDSNKPDKPKSEQTSVSPTNLKNVIQGKVLVGGSPLRNFEFHAADGHGKKEEIKVETNDGGAFVAPIISDYMLFYVEAYDVKLKNKQVSLEGTIISDQDVRVYGNELSGKEVKITKLLEMAVGHNELVSASDMEKLQQYNYKTDEEYKKALNDYGAKEIPGVVFKVQVGAFRDPSNFKKEKFKDFASLKSYVMDDGITRFTVGEYKLLNQAERLKQELIKMGHNDVFIVAFENGERKLDFR